MHRDKYILLTLVVLYGIVVSLPVLILKIGKLYGVLLPELARFETYLERRCAVRTSCAHDHVLTWFVLIMLAIQAVLWVLVGGKSWSSTAPLWLFLTVFCFGPYLMANAVFWLFFRDSIRRSLREQLAERGVPICIRCGYDLRGQIEPRCPECGRPAPSPGNEACKAGKPTACMTPPEASVREE